MEASIVLHNKSPLLSPIRQKVIWSNKPRVLSVLTRSTNDVEVVSSTKTAYKDSWLDIIAINHLSRSLQSTTGFTNNKSGYESLVEAASATMRNFGPVEQRELVVKAIDKALPRPILAMIKMLLPDSKFTREYFAAFTTVFFTWLMGKCEVRESELDGKRERNVVHINKCRFLEQSNCVGMCNNLCKMPSQTFIKDSFGIPVYMVPNFEDMSCEMIFGQDPPELDEDPALKQPCFKLCKAKQRHSTPCSI